MILETDNASWEMILSLAQNAKERNEKFYSPKEKNAYKIRDVLHKITIVRESGEVSILGKRGYWRFLEHFNEGNGRYKRSAYKGIIAKMAAIMHLHPWLKWDAENEWMYVEKDEIRGPIEDIDFDGIPNDDEVRLQKMARRVRKGQPRFRAALMTLYGNACCLSGCGVSEVLEACHIEPHTKQGLNAIGNGLLLRSDLHTLFDERGLFIEPITMIIHVDPKLKSSDYWLYNGKQLRKRIDRTNPDYQYLADRWVQKKW